MIFICKTLLSFIHTCMLLNLLTHLICEVQGIELSGGVGLRGRPACRLLLPFGIQFSPKTLVLQKARNSLDNPLSVILLLGRAHAGALYELGLVDGDGFRERFDLLVRDDGVVANVRHAIVHLIVVFVGRPYLRRIHEVLF